MNREMVERLALALNGGSFTNDYQKKHCVRQVVEMLAALTEADLVALLKEKTGT